MSAIWGCVDLSGQALPHNLCEEMRKPLDNYKIDRYAAVSAGNVAFGCGIQYIHENSDKEPLPIYDEAEGLYFTADCIIDNREDVAAALGLSSYASMPDGELLFLAYKHWREDMPKHVIGSYSFAAYDEKSAALQVAADHVLSRSIYYSRRGSRVYFSTLIEPILQGIGGTPSLDEGYVSGYLATSTLGMLRDAQRTIYAGVNRVVAAEYMCFTIEKEQRVPYWSWREIKPLALADDAAYRRQFIDLYSKIVGQMCRTAGGVAILQSGGFDSCSVACMAAPLLAAQNKRLNAYTYVPLQGFDSPYSKRYFNTNEKTIVEELCALYPNIVPHFMSLPDEDGFCGMARLQDCVELPFKSFLNLAWMDAMEHAAGADGCKVMLTGQFGNSTVSSGSALTYIKTVLRRGQLIRGFGTLNRYCRQWRFSRRRMFPHMALDVFLPDFVRRKKSADDLQGAYVNRELYRRQQKEKNGQTPAQGAAQLTYRQECELTFSPVSFAHISDSETKMGLASGIVLRDPTRDIRMMSFCLAVPMECKVNSVPETRRLCRVYLADRLPASMLPETTPRGRQSGDWRERILPKWGVVSAEMRRVLKEMQPGGLVDAGEIETALRRLDTLSQHEDEEAFYAMVAVYALGLFLQNRQWENLENIKNKEET